MIKRPRANTRTRVVSSIMSGLLCVAANAESAASDDSGFPEIGGVLMLDYSLLNDYLRPDANADSSSEQFETELRRARISMKHQLDKSWRAKLQVNFDEEEGTSEIGDAYVQYKGLKDIDLTFGQMKESIGLENLTSSKNLTFLERSMATKAFTPGRSKGLQLSLPDKQTTWSVGVYDVETDTDDSQPYAITSRLTWSPVLRGGSMSSDTLLHVGASGSWRDMDGSEFELNERVELHSTDSFIESNGFDADKISTLGLEAALSYGEFSFQGEYLSSSISGVNAADDATLDGYYLQTSYFLSGESRPYKKGLFKTVQPYTSSGAWEVAARYSALNTRELEEGDKYQTATLGLNYYYDANLRLMTNVLYSRVSKPVEDNDESTGIAFRLQYAF